MKKIAAFGMIILISVSPLFRGLYFSYEAYAFLAAIAFFSILYCFSKMMNHEPYKINRLFIFFSIVLIAATILSFFTALNPRENMGSLMLFAELLMVFIVLYDYFSDKKQLLMQVLMLTTILSGFVCAILGVMALTGKFNIGEVTTTGNRVGSTFQYANTASIYFLICFLFAISLANAAKSIIIRALSAGIGSIILFALFMTGSRGGYLIGIAMILLLLVIQPAGRRITGVISFFCMLVPAFIIMNGFNSSTTARDNFGAMKWLVIAFLLAVIFCLLFNLLMKVFIKDKNFTMPKGSGFIAAVVAVVALVMVWLYRDSLIATFPPVMVKRLERLVTQGFNDINILYRLDFDKDAIKLLASNWLLGLGGGGWKALYHSVQDYFYTAVFVHNHYFQLFVEHGILGFLSFISLVFVSCIGAIHSFIKAKEKVLKTYAAGLLCGILALAGHAAVDFDLSFVSLILLLWVMFVISAISLPDASGMNDKVAKKPFFINRWKTEMKSSTGRILLLITCSILFSIHALYFAGAYNRQIAYKHMQKEDYRTAMVYYEEAYRLDPSNTAYTFELAKLYHFYGTNSKKEENIQLWLEKAREAGEKSVSGNKNYPAHMNTLVRIYLDSGMPLDALELARNLVLCHKYNGETYELLARSYLAAAQYYENSGDFGSAKDLLLKCIAIDKDPYLRRSKIDKPYDVNSEKVISSYKHSKELAEYLRQAEHNLKKYE